MRLGTNVSTEEDGAACTICFGHVWCKCDADADADAAADADDDMKIC